MTECSFCTCDNSTLLCQYESCQPLTCSNPVRFEGICCRACPYSKFDFVMVKGERIYMRLLTHPFILEFSFWHALTLCTRKCILLIRIWSFEWWRYSIQSINSIQFTFISNNSIAKYTTQNNNICIKIHSKWIYTNNMNIIKQSRSWYGGIFKRPAAYTEMPFNKDIQEKGGLKTNQRRQTKKQNKNG